jgi:hypothetical protein
MMGSRGGLMKPSLPLMVSGETGGDSEAETKVEGDSEGEDKAMLDRCYFFNLVRLLELESVETRRDCA